MDAKSSKKISLSPEEIIDQEWLEAGATPEELERCKELSTIFDRLLASGRTVEDINTEWEAKTPEAILQEYASLPTPAENRPSNPQPQWLHVNFVRLIEGKPRRSWRGRSLATPPLFVFSTQVTLRNGRSQRYEQAILVKDDRWLKLLRECVPRNRVEILLEIDWNTEGLPAILKEVKVPVARLADDLQEDENTPEQKKAAQKTGSHLSDSE